MSEKSNCRVDLGLPKPKGLNSDFPKINFFDLDFFLPTFDPKRDLYLLKLPTPYFSFDGDLDRLRLEFLDLAIETFSIHFGTIENELNLENLKLNLKLDSVYLKPRKGSNLEILFSLDLPSFKELELGRVFNTDFSLPELRFLEIEPKKLQASLDVMFRGFKLHRKKYAAFKKINLKGLYFDISGKPFDFDKFIGKLPGIEAPVLSIYPDLKAFFEPKSINLDFDIGNILFAFDPDMKLHGFKIKSLNPEIPNMSFSGKDIDFLLRRPSFSMPTLNNFLFNIKDINFDLKARVPMSWLDFSFKYAFPSVKLKGLDDFKLELGDIDFMKNLQFDGNLPGFDPIDPDFDLSLAIAKAFKKPTIGKFGLEIRDINLKNAGLSLDLNPNLDLEFDPKLNMGKLGKFKNNLDIPEFPDIEIIIDQILLEFNKLNFDSPDLKILWDKLLGKIKMPGLIDLLKGCLSALLKNLSLDFSLKIILCNALKSFPKDDIIRLLNSFPTEIQAEVFGLVKAELDEIPCLGGPYLDLFLEAAASGRVGLDNELEDVFNILIEIICDFFAGEVGKHKLDLQVSAFTELQEQRKLDRKFELKNKCKVQKPNLDLDLSLDPGELERKRLAFSGADIGIDPGSVDLGIGGLGGLDGLGGLGGLGGIGGLGGVGGLGTLGLDGIDLPGFEAGKFVGFKNPLEGLGLLLKFLNFFPGAPIVSFALSKLDFPELPDFDAKIPDFMNALDLPDLSIGEISLPKLENPLGKIPTFFDLQKIGMDLSFDLILSIAIKVLLNLIKKSLNGKRRGNRKNLDLGLNPDISFGNGELALPDLVGGGFDGDLDSLNATFKIAGLDLDTDIGLDFIKELSLSLTPLELTNLVIGKPDPSSIDIILNLVEFKFPDLKIVFDSRQAVIEFFSNISFSLPMDYKTSLKKISLELGKGPNFDLPLAIELCNVDANVDIIRENRKNLLKGRLPDDILEDVAFLDELLDIEDVEDIARALQLGVDNVMAKAMPPMFPEEPGGESIFELEPQPIVDAIMNKIDGDIQHMEVAFNNDLLGAGKSGFWGSLNMLLSDTKGNPLTSHKRYSQNSKTYVDSKTLLKVEVPPTGSNEKIGEGAYPTNVAYYLYNTISSSVGASSFNISLSEELINFEDIGPTRCLKRYPTFSYPFQDNASGIYNIGEDKDSPPDPPLYLYSSSIDLFVSEVRLNSPAARVLSDNYRLRIRETRKDYDVSPSASPLSSLPLPPGLDFKGYVENLGVTSFSLTPPEWGDLEDIEETKIELFSFDTKTDFSILTEGRFSNFLSNVDDIASNPNVSLLSRYLNTDIPNSQLFLSDWTSNTRKLIFNSILANSSSFDFGFTLEGEYTGWFGLVEDLMIDDEDREVKSPLSFEGILDVFKEKYSKIEEDKRLAQEPCFRVKYPFKRLLDKSTKVSLMATFETMLAAYARHHIIKAFNFYSVFKLDFDNLSDLTADYVLWHLENNAKNPRVINKNPEVLVDSSNKFWLRILELSVEYYIDMLQTGDIKNPPPSIVSYLEFLNEQRANFGTYKTEFQLLRFIESVECECRYILRELIKKTMTKSYDDMNDFFASFEREEGSKFKNMNLFSMMLQEADFISGVIFNEPGEFSFDDDYVQDNELIFLDVNRLPYHGPVKTLTLLGKSSYFRGEPGSEFEQCDVLKPILREVAFDSIGSLPDSTSPMSIQIFVYRDGQKLSTQTFETSPSEIVKFGIRLLTSTGSIILDYVDYEDVAFCNINTREGFDRLINNFIKSPEYNMLFNYCLMNNKLMSLTSIYITNNLYPSIGQDCHNDAGLSSTSTFVFEVEDGSFTVTTTTDDNSSVTGWLNVEDRDNKSDGVTNLIWDDWERDELMLTTRRFKAKMDSFVGLLDILPGSKLVSSSSKEDRRQKKAKLFNKKKK